ncbi:zf-HC2 domain-containing protein [Clostridium gasigenes]|uniref:zf-HC2 domain-containing protein n=1 Tax=Clostridium gasigenes TaxID=94869 RepID=UPI001C0C9794|nr:zf-HC2 domain-containing protein [Clostridium gasigenes]MBU3105608.1 zf-HC2 domain-containing protein [Clostridium gasigenes]
MSKIKCEVVQDLITLYVDNLASKESNNIIENHIVNCSDCKIFLEMLKRDEIITNVVDKNNKAVDSVEKKLIISIRRRTIKRNLLALLVLIIIVVLSTLLDNCSF